MTEQQHLFIMVRIGGLVLNRSVVASIGKTTDSAMKAKELGADLLELRIDLLESDPEDSLKELKRTDMPVIITNRMREEGGSCTMCEDERIETLISLLPRADAVDIELCAQRRDAVVEKAKSMGKTVIISTHDFQRTPETDVMEEIIRESFEAGCDIAKLAVTPHSLEDVLRLLRVTLQSRKAVCTIAMGEIGKHARVMAPIYGSVMTYGYVGEKTAPGQLRVDELGAILKLLS